MFVELSGYVGRERRLVTRWVAVAAIISLEGIGDDTTAVWYGGVANLERIDVPDPVGKLRARIEAATRPARLVRLPSGTWVDSQDVCRVEAHPGSLPDYEADPGLKARVCVLDRRGGIHVTHVDSWAEAERLRDTVARDFLGSSPGGTDG
jgi:hypothetical protein